MLDSILNASTTTASTTSTAMAFFYTIIAGILGVLVSITYRKTGKVSHNFARTLVVLPMLVCVVMLVVNGNLGTSVAIVGAFSLIRFRSLQGSSRDIAFVFFAMTLGLTCSVGQLLFAAGITILICAVLLVLSLTNYAQNKTEEKELRVTIPENLDYSNIFDDLFEKYTKENHLVKVKTTNMGSLYELTYFIQLNFQAQEKELIDAIRCRNGNLTVICGKRNYDAMEEL